MNEYIGKNVVMAAEGMISKPAPEKVNLENTAESTECGEHTPQIGTAAVLGAGAVGSYLIQGLSEKLGENLWVIAEGDRKKRLETQGLLINEKNYQLYVRTPEEAHGVDVLFVCLKYGSLVQALDAVETIVGQNTMVLSLMNGVDSEEILAERIGMEHIVHALIKIASQRSGGEVRFALPEGKTLGIFVGIPEVKAADSPRVQAILRLFEGTSVNIHPSDRILREIWLKYTLNVGMNIPQGILGVGIGLYYDSVYGAELARHLQEEVYAVAEAKGIKMPKWMPLPRKLIDPASRYSTLQDLDAGRKTEVEMFCGTLIRMGRELGVPVPYCECCYAMIKALEEKNEGKFDYR